MKQIKKGEALRIFLEEHPEYCLIADPRHPKNRIGKEEIKKIKDLHNKGMSLRELGQSFERSHEAIRTIIKTN